MENSEQINNKFNKKKTKSKKGLLISALVILILIVVLVLIYFMIFTKPQFVFGKAIDKIFTTKKEETESIKLDYKIKADIDTNNKNIEEYTKEIEKYSLKFGAQIDVNSKQEIVDVGLDYNGKEEVNAEIYYNSEDMYLYLNGLFDKYIEAELSEEQKESLEEIFEMVEIEKQKKSMKIEKILRGEIKSQIKEKGEFEKTKETRIIDGKEEKFNKYTLELSQESLIDILSNIILNLSENKEFLEFFEDDTFENNLKKAGELLQKENKEIDKFDINIKINIYTKGMLNKFAGVDIETNFNYNSQNMKIGLELTKKEENLYSYSLRFNTKGVNTEVISGKVDIQKEKDSKNEQKGKMIVTAELAKFIAQIEVKLEIDYSVEYNGGIDKIDISNSVKINEITEEEKKSIIEKIKSKQLIGNLVASKDNEVISKAQKSTFQTEVSIIKEQLEITKAAKLIENNGILLNDYSSITVGSLTNVDAKIRDKYTNKLVVDKDGNLCYNLENVTLEEKTWLEEIGIKASSKE